MRKLPVTIWTHRTNGKEDPLLRGNQVAQRRANKVLEHSISTSRHQSQVVVRFRAQRTQTRSLPNREK